jgi:hypothetical protein
MFRCNGAWFVVEEKKGEPLRQTLEIAWKIAKEGVDNKKAYRSWYEKERKITSKLYNE